MDTNIHASIHINGPFHLAIITQSVKKIIWGGKFLKFLETLNYLGFKFLIVWLIYWYLKNIYGEIHAIGSFH